MLMILAVGFTFTPDLKWNSYMRSMAKTAGKKGLFFASLLNSSCHTLSSSQGESKMNCFYHTEAVAVKLSLSGHDTFQKLLRDLVRDELLSTLVPFLQRNHC